MANWKKMAEAFGELAGRNMQKGKASNVDDWSRNAASKSKDTRKAYAEGKQLGKAMQESADEIDAAAERGETRYLPRPNDMYYDDLKEVNQLNKGPGHSLEKDFEEEFEDALKQSVDNYAERARRSHRSFPGDEPLEVNKVTTEDAIRRQAIEMLKKGETIPDVLDILRAP